MSERAYKESDSVSRMAVSSTLSVLMEAERLRAEGVDVVDLGAGEPDFPTPDNVKQAGGRAIEQDLTRYTSTSGITPLRQAILDMIERDFGASYTLPQVLVTIGGKQAIFNAMATLINPGDDVLIPSPYWVTFPEIVTFLRGNSIILDTEPNRFVLTADMIRDRVTARTRLLIINSPNNPTGRVIPPDEYRKIIEVAAERDIWVISDECYLYFAYPPASPFTAGQLPSELRERVMISGSFSKSHAMTGWRIGYALGPEEWIRAMLKVQSHSTSNATSISQYAALEAATGPQDSLHFMIGEYRKRRDWLAAALNKIEGIECTTPEGAFYMMPNVKQLLGGRAKSSAELARILLEEARVVVTPGSSFGIEGYLRISYANSLEVIRRGVERLADVVKTLR